jgi:integrase
MLTVRQSAEYLGCSVWVVRGLCHSRVLPFSQRVKNGTITIDLLDLDRYIETHKLNALPNPVTTPVLGGTSLAGASCPRTQLVLRGNTHEEANEASGSVRHNFEVVEHGGQLRTDSQTGSPIPSELIRPNQAHPSNRVRHVAKGLERQPWQNSCAPRSQADAEQGCRKEIHLYKGRVMAKRPNGFIYQRKGSQFLWIGYRRAGRLVRESSGTTDLNKAEDLLRQRQLMVLSGTIDTLSTTVDDLYAMVLQDYQLKRKASILDIQARWNLHLKQFFGGLYAHEVKSELITHYQQKRLGQKAAPSTINRELAVLRRAYNLGRRNKRVLADHVPFVEMLTENNVRKGFVEPQQYGKLVAECNKVGLWLRAMFECGYTWGFRVSELQNLRVHQIDLTGKLVRLEVGETKNGEGREVPMTPTICELLKVCIEGKQPNDYVFSRGSGKRIADFRVSWKKATTNAGMPALLFHDLRRSAVRIMVRAGINQNVAMAISGHKTASVFARYNIVSAKDKFEGMLKREAYLQSVSEKSDEAEQTHSAHNEGRTDAPKSEKQNPKLLN